MIACKIDCAIENLLCKKYNRVVVEIKHVFPRIFKNNTFRVLQYWVLSINIVSVFHRILDFKNGVEFLFRPLYFAQNLLYIKRRSRRKAGPVIY
jgi:hypothetical protein